MKRVMVIGPPGSGKSRLARRLGDITGLPVVHLDRMLWRPGWVMTPKDEETQILAELYARDAWIIDGHYGGSIPARIKRADTVVLLDLSRRIYLRRILRRLLTNYRRVRPDMGAGCPERLDLFFWRWAWRFARDTRPATLAALADSRHPNVVALLSPRDVRAYEARIRERFAAAARAAGEP